MGDASWTCWSFELLDADVNATTPIPEALPMPPQGKKSHRTHYKGDDTSAKTSCDRCHDVGFKPVCQHKFAMAARHRVTSRAGAACDEEFYMIDLKHVGDDYCAWWYDPGLHNAAKDTPLEISIGTDNFN